MAYFQDPVHRRRLEDLLKELTIVEEEGAGAPQTLAGLTFVITGSVTHFANRSEVKALIESMGGKVTGSVTSKTDYLINNDVESTSSKNKKARRIRNSHPFRRRIPGDDTRRRPIEERDQTCLNTRTEMKKEWRRK